MRNRLANTKNPYQGSRLKTLCVCSAGLLRSPTLAYVLQQKPFLRNTRAVGITTEFALIPMDEALVEWADEIIFVEPSVHETAVMKFGGMPTKEIWTLDIPDRYEAFNPDLIAIIKEQLSKYEFT